MNQINTKIFSVVILIAAVVALAVFFVIRPQVRTLMAEREEIAKNQSQTLEIQRQTEDLRRALTQLNQVAAVRQKVVSLFPNREEMENSVKGLEAAADAAGVTLDLFITDRAEQTQSASGERVKPVVAGLTGVEEVPFTAEFSGSWRQILDFFIHFDHSPFLTRVTGLSAVAKTEAGADQESIVNSGSAVARMTGVFFMRVAR